MQAIENACSVHAVAGRALAVVGNIISRKINGFSPRFSHCFLSRSITQTQLYFCDEITMPASILYAKPQSCQTQAKRFEYFSCKTQKAIKFSSNCMTAFLQRSYNISRLLALSLYIYYFFLFFVFLPFSCFRFVEQPMGKYKFCPHSNQLALDRYKEMVHLAMA